RDGRRAVSASYDGTVRLWDVKTGAQLQCFRGHAENVNTAVISPDGAYVFSAGGVPQEGYSSPTSPAKDPTIRQWKTKDGNEERQLSGHTHLVRRLALSEDGSRLLSASYDSTCRVWDIATGSQIDKLSAGEIVTTVALSRDGKRAALGAL